MMTFQDVMMYSKVIPSYDTEDKKDRGNGASEQPEMVKIDTTGKGMSFADFGRLISRKK